MEGETQHDPSSILYRQLVFLKINTDKGYVSIVLCCPEHFCSRQDSIEDTDVSRASKAVYETCFSSCKCNSAIASPSCSDSGGKKNIPKDVNR